MNKSFSKKIVAASIALASVSAFAEWDYYPVLDEHHGQGLGKSFSVNSCTKSRFFHFLFG